MTQRELALARYRFLTDRSVAERLHHGLFSTATVLTEPRQLFGNTPITSLTLYSRLLTLVCPSTGSRMIVVGPPFRPSAMATPRAASDRLGSEGRDEWGQGVDAENE
ncbi:hypothetical protein GCM10009039_29950 [Halocalculus aciditolerans]|uniref:Uncharacterized protein n=1 Tax=Halocalculus aciditolerans TaxID=1383812 RepID=A0A830FMB9_9EURY|nr:hypothetical protein GCM10009039_29950 [Halocalculus aciditolerans]